MTIIGISGSPVPKSNTDRALRIALDATGEETEFIKLSDYTYQACRACLGCEETNVCVLKDDATALAQKIRYADALIVAGYPPYGYLDGRTKSFLERLWCLRHKHGFLRGKPGGNHRYKCSSSGKCRDVPFDGTCNLFGKTFYDDRRHGFCRCCRGFGKCALCRVRSRIRLPPERGHKGVRAGCRPCLNKNPAG